MRFFGRKSEPVASQFDSRSHDALQAELSVFLFRIHQSSHGAGCCDGAIANHAGIWNDIALRVLVHRLGRRQWRLFSKVDEGGLAIVRAQEQKTTTAKVAGDWMHDGKRESGGHGR